MVSPPSLSIPLMSLNQNVILPSVLPLVFLFFSYDRSHTIQSKFINVEALQKKVRILEEDNLQLRMETAEMKTKTLTIEEKEAQLVQDAFKQLGELTPSLSLPTTEVAWFRRCVLLSRSFAMFAA